MAISKTLAEDLRRLLSHHNVAPDDWAAALADFTKTLAAPPQSLPPVPEPVHKREFPPAFAWPSETFSEAHKERGENIVQFLERVWLPLAQQGLADLRDLRRDKSAITAISNYTRRNPITGQQRQLPPHLRFPTLHEVNTRALSQMSAAELAEDARLSGVAFSRARRKPRSLDI